MALKQKDSNEGSNEIIKTFDEKKRSEKESKKGNILSRIFAVLCAMVVWFYVVGVESPVFERSFTDMNMDIINLKNGYSVLSGYDNKVSVVLSGKKSDINRLKYTDIDIYVDAGTVTQPGEHSLSVKVDAGSDINVVSVSPENVLLYLDKTTTVNIPVSPVIGTSVIAAGLFLEDPVCTPATVSVTGSEEILKSIKQARVNINLGTVTQSMVVRQGITFIDKDGAEIDNRYISTDISVVSVDIPVYTKKEIPLKVAYKNGFFDDTNSKINISPSTVTVKGTPAMLDNINELVVDTIDETKILDDQVKKVPITLPEGIKSVDGVTSADIDIKLTQNFQKKIVLTTFNVKAPPAGLNYTIEDKNITVTLRGTEAALSHITVFNLKANVDLSLYAEKGTYNLVPVEITVSSGDRVYALGDYTVTVKIE